MKTRLNLNHMFSLWMNGGALIHPNSQSKQQQVLLSLVTAAQQGHSKRKPQGYV